MDFCGVAGTPAASRGWGVSIVLGLYLISNSLSSMAHFISLHKVSGLCNICFIGCSVETSIV